MKQFSLSRFLLILFFSSTLFTVCGCASNSHIQQQELAIAKANFAVNNYELAFKRLLPLAEQNNSEAQYAIGYLYYYGYGVDRNEERAYYWLRQAAKQQNKQAIKALALLRTAENSAFYTPPELK